VAALFDRALTVWDDAALAHAWCSAEPFPHVVVDDFRATADLVDLLDAEPVEQYQADIYIFDASAPEPATAELRTIRDAFATALAPRLSRITNKPLARADMRAFAYRPGHYLLPHADHQDGLARQLAFAYYLPSPDPPVGGELELFRVTPDGRTTSARLIEPVPNRLVIFDVSDVSLHQVREVLSGLRLSLAGWFYP
jgi:Rps23 Pro-64 3,4-dihydroxylase Tpa1-like proline 4-hydroxylase